MTPAGGDQLSLPTLGPVDLLEAPTTLRLLTTLARLVRTRDRAPALGSAVEQRALAVVEHARSTVPFYRDHYSADQFARVADIPVVTKASLAAAAFADRLSTPDPPAGCRRLTTAGTTGVPFEMLYPPAFRRWQALLRFRVDLDRRYRPWDRWVALVNSTPGVARRVPWHLRWLSDRVRSVPISADIENIAAIVGHHRPHRMSGHPNRLLDVGHRLAPDALPGKVSTHGETLEPALRRAIEQVYGTDPLDWYGTAEVGLIAVQCWRADLYHVQHESVLLEVLDDTGAPVPPGGSGDVVVTGLHNGLMPMIRYQLHDRVTTADRPCECGYHGPALKRIVGRSMDVLHHADGRALSPELFWLFGHRRTELLVRCVRRYQVRQDADGAVEVRLELREPIPTDELSALEASYRALSDQPTVVKVVDDIGDGTPGRFRLICSEISRPAASPQRSTPFEPVDDRPHPE